MIVSYTCFQKLRFIFKQFHLFYVRVTLHLLSPYTKIVRVNIHCINLGLHLKVNKFCKHKFFTFNF